MKLFRAFRTSTQTPFIFSFLVTLLQLLNGGNSNSLTEVIKPPSSFPNLQDSQKKVIAPAIKPKNRTIKAWSAPSDLPKPLPPQTVYAYSVEMLTALVKNFHDHSSSNDPLNEAYYTKVKIADNVWFNIERVAPLKMFMDWAIGTNQIMDRDIPNGTSLIKRYIQNASVPCLPGTAFQIPEDIIMSDDKRRRIALDPMITQWLKSNHEIPPEKICNKFRGLTCSNKTKTCECESRDNTVRFVTYDRTEQFKPGEYRDGCYVKPWRKCSHLSLDTKVPTEYKSFHAGSSNMKQFLLRLATPLPRMPRCEKGSYCVDMILNQHKPICWCASRMYSKDCFSSGIPLLEQFLEIRKQFHQMIIPERDNSATCSRDINVDGTLQDIMELLENVPANHRTILRLMKEVIAKGGKGARICDFRKGLACDPYRRICTYRTGCGPGRVAEEGLSFGRECRINNGYPCPIIETQCVNGATCKDFGQGRHCHCAEGRFGHLCRFTQATFFGSLIQSRISGFVGYQFANLQELVNHILIPVERLMTLSFREKCDPSLDRFAMTIVGFMGGVRLVNLELLDEATSAVQYLVGRDEPLCNYRRFLGCTKNEICEPMIPDVAKYEVKPTMDYPGRAKIYLSLRPIARCYGPGNYSNIPPIYRDIIHVQCLPHHQCRKVGGKMNSRHKYCLCPQGYQGVGCNEKVGVRQAKNVEVYEIPENIRTMPVIKNDGKMEKHIDVIHTV